MFEICEGFFSLKWSSRFPVVKSEEYIPMSDYADLFLDVLVTSVSTPERKFWIFQSDVVREVTYWPGRFVHADCADRTCGLLGRQWCSSPAAIRLWRRITIIAILFHAFCIHTSEFVVEYASRFIHSSNLRSEIQSGSFRQELGVEEDMPDVHRTCKNLSETTFKIISGASVCANASTARSGDNLNVVLSGDVQEPATIFESIVALPFLPQAYMQRS
ncbi:Protein phosphatase 2C 32 [Platanthera zijinensis]|uniref:Protein phosphatase 2C 32 n=1 Tax=Platanthera zijinensis TaxID=2320716 RepID=A0AAP0C375_9ASPA